MKMGKFPYMASENLARDRGYIGIQNYMANIAYMQQVLDIYIYATSEAVAGFIQRKSILLLASLFHRFAGYLWPPNDD